MSKGRAKQKQTKRVVREVIAREQRRQRALWTSIVAALLLVIAGMVGYGVYAGQRPAGKYVPPPGITDTLGVPVGSGPVTVDIYADFMCPACRTFEEAVGDTLDQLVSENKVTVVYHPVAFLDRYSSTQYSTRSSAASGCAAEVGRIPRLPHRALQPAAVPGRPRAQRRGTRVYRHRPWFRRYFQ